MVTTDYFTKWIEVEPLSRINKVVIKAFVWKNIICRFGTPHNGLQFTSSFIADMYKELKICHLTSTLRYSQNNGQTEASNKIIINSLKKKVEAMTSSWTYEIPGHIE